MSLPGHDDYMDGVLDSPGSRDKIRLPSEQVMYDLGRRVGGKDRPRVRMLTHSQIAEGHAFLRASILLGLVGAVGGLGYGLWQWITVSGASAVTVLKWIGIGAGAGALALSALIVALGIGVMWVVFMGLGLLLNFLTGL